MWVGLCARGRRTSQASGQSPALLPLASELPAKRGGGRLESRGPGRLTPAGQWRSPLSALQSSRRPRIGRSPPIPTPGGGAERTAARVSRRGYGPEPPPARGSPPPPATARPRRPARPGSEPPRPSPEGRPLPRPLPPPRQPHRASPPPRAPRRRHAAFRGPAGRAVGLRPAAGLRGAARLPLRHGRRCPVSPLTSAILVPLGRTSSAEPSPRMGRLSQSQPPPPPPPPRPARHPPGGRGGSAPYRAGQPATPPARSHTHAVRRSRGRRSCTRPPRAPTALCPGWSKVPAELRASAGTGRCGGGTRGGGRGGGGRLGGGLDGLPEVRRST